MNRCVAAYFERTEFTQGGNERKGVFVICDVPSGRVTTCVFRKGCSFGREKWALVLPMVPF